MKPHGMRALLCLCLLAWAVAPALADEIADQLERGLKLYREGKVTEALNEVEFATVQMRQKKAESFAQVFPPAPAGFQAEKVESQAAGQALFGGGVSASRVYRKGETEVKVEIMSDSPLIQPLAMVLTNPALAQGQGQKLIRAGDQRAVVQHNGDDQAELSMLVDNKVLVKVEAYHAAGAAELVKDFAGKVNLAKLRELSK